MLRLWQPCRYQSYCYRSQSRPGDVYNNAEDEVEEEGEEEVQEEGNILVVVCELG